MGRKAKRANRPNQRSDRMNMETKDNVLDINAHRDVRKKKVEIIPKNNSQELFLENLEDDSKNICFAVGPAGTGKTLMATLAGIRAFKTGQVNKIVITRPNVAVDDRDIGYLPGSMYEKMSPWVRPIMDIFEEYYSPKYISKLMEDGLLEICPVAYIRGRTFKNCWMLIDEAQGTTCNSMKSILTRIGDNSKYVVTGDVEQTDIGKNNGLQDFIERFNDDSELISLTKFKKTDIERHPAVKEVLNIYGEN